MAKHYWVTEYFREPMCPLGCGMRMGAMGPSTSAPRMG